MRARFSAKHGALLLPLLAAAAFWIPAWPKAHGWFPTPLDDTFIHFDYARSIAEGAPFAWLPGQGYSSGETAPLYAVLLAAGYLVGFRGRFLGGFAGLIAVAAVAIYLRSLLRLVRGSEWLRAAACLLPLSIGVLDWTLFSGMEVALFAAFLGAALVALAGTRGPRRQRAQQRLGLLGMALVLLRPEAVVVVAIFGVVAARGVRRRSAIAALLRTALPATLVMLGSLAINRALTGDARSAGAALKLLSSNPYLSDVARARVYVENLVVLGIKIVRGELSFGAILLVVLGGVGLFGRMRHVVLACLASALAWTLLTSWNGNAPHHNFRYYAPALLLLASAAALGAASLRRAGAPLLLATSVLLLLRLPAQSTHFGKAVANVRDQQIEVGTRLAGIHGRLLVGDAGAIPYVSGKSAIDALGLGGFARMPFTRAAVHGEAATVELIERLAPAERPTHLALYPNWFSAITGRFGREIDRVTITDNVICGGTTKAIYLADWSALDTPHAPESAVVDEIDEGDVVSEQAHDYVAPFPDGGWMTLDVRRAPDGRRLFDGGRILPHGTVESFVVRAPAGRLRLRADGDGVRVRVRDQIRPVLLAAGAGAWHEGAVDVDVRSGDVVTLDADTELRSYHVWLERR